MLSPLLLTLLPIVLILVLLLVFRTPADISGVLGWLAVCLVAWLWFSTSPEVILRSTASGLIRSWSVSLIVAASLLQMAVIEKSGALKRITIFIKTIASENRPVQIMMINIGFGTLMVAVGATPVSVLPPILVAMGYSTSVAIALPAIGYDALCTYALLGAPIVVFVDIANSFLGPGQEVALHEAGMVFYMFLPLVATMIGLCMLWIVGRWDALKSGLLPCLLTGATIALVAWFTNRSDNLVVLTGVLCGLAVMLVMALYLLAGGHPVLDGSRLTGEERDYARSYPLWRAFLPWTLLVLLILCLNLPQQSFDWLYRTMKLPINGLTADGRPLETRLLWQAYTWILVSTLLALPFLRLSGGKMREALQVWLRRAPRPVFAAAIFFAIGEVMNMSGYDMASRSFATPSMVRVLADQSALLFQDGYGLVVAFIGLFGGFITGSEASTIAMFAKYTLATANKLDLSREGLLIVTAGLAFGGGLASVISPAKLQNAAAAIDRIGEEGAVIRIAFIFAIGLTLVTALFVAILLWFNG